MRAYDSIKAERGREVNLEAPDFLEQARKLLSQSTPVEIRMSGSSMRPAIEDGDMVIVEPIIDEKIKPGDVVLYQTRQETAVIHRVIRIERGSNDRLIITRGDASSQNDLPTPWHRVIGQVRQVERAGERIRVTGPKHKYPIRFFALLHRLQFWKRR